MKKKASQNDKKQDKNEINRHKNNSPVVSLNRENKINWTDNMESPRWGHGIGNPQRDDDGKIQPRMTMLEKKQVKKSTNFCVVSIFPIMNFPFLLIA